MRPADFMSAGRLRFAALGGGFHQVWLAVGVRRA